MFTLAYTRPKQRFIFIPKKAKFILCLIFTSAKVTFLMKKEKGKRKNKSPADKRVSRGKLWRCLHQTHSDAVVTLTLHCCCRFANRNNRCEKQDMGRVSLYEKMKHSLHPYIFSFTFRNRGIYGM